jgi:nucleoporin NUP1
MCVTRVTAASCLNFPGSLSSTSSMASSPASQGGHHRRRLNARRQPLSRTNTLFGAIKNIVTAPLSWFASTDDFEDTRDNSGKRRRLAPVQTEPTINEEDMAPRTKRMRVDSPSRELRREGAYLDPPQAVFEQPPSIGRSASMGIQVANAQLPAVGITGNYVRSTLTPLRNLSISRTMSIDPPRPQSRDGGVFQSQRPLGSNQDMDSSMESVLPLPPVFASSASSLPRTSLSMPRDMSRPHSRPPFRMRTSLTPQPAAIQRERSEPPPLHLLKAHPTFVKPPPLEEGSRVGSNEPDTTLGSLVDSARRVRHLRLDCCPLVLISLPRLSHLLVSRALSCLVARLR